MSHFKNVQSLDKVIAICTPGWEATITPDNKTFM
jgi:hypothetical protein